MAVLKPLFLIPLLALAACGGPADVAGTEDASVATAAGPEAGAEPPLDPKLAAEMDKLKEQLAANAAAKPAFDAAKAANDEIKLDELADSGNAHALYDRAVKRIASEDYMLQQGGYDDMQAASELALPEAMLWVGQRMAFGKEGYKLQPSSGLKMMEKAAAQGNLEAIMAVAGMYAQDAYMSDRKKALEWYDRAAKMGSEEAKSWIDTLGAGALPGVPGN